MTFDLRNFNPGDRVLAMSKTNNDTAEFDVLDSRPEFLDSENNTFMADDWDFTLVKAAKADLPTVAGVYAQSFGGRNLLLTSAGSWYWIDFTTSGSDEKRGFRYQGDHVKKKDMAEYAGHLTLLWEYNRGD